LRKKPEDVLSRLKDRLEFMTEIGADFMFPPDAAPLKAPDKAEILARLREKILTCRLCPLAAGRTQAVPGEGNITTELMFVGEAPGHDEDVQGRPFVGRAGRLLTRIIEAMKYRREEVFIANVVKCRPPGNRTPQRDEVEKCQAYLLAQIRAIRPKVIVALGKVSTDFFHPSTLAMGELRGRFFEFDGISVMPTFHPAYILRNEGNKEVKKLVWQDMQNVMALLDKK
jgi:DNA polymerase